MKGNRKDTTRPEWAPVDAGEEFTSSVMPGVTLPDERKFRDVKRRKELTAAEHIEGVLAGDRTITARTITLVESSAAAHTEKAGEVLKGLLSKRRDTLRVGVTGVPGVGKSTFIEALGCMLLEAGKRVAVLAIDPTSCVTGGSILGDKTRMERLSRDPRCFIRPSPTGGTLGGVAAKTRETMLVLEAAGYDVVLIETVGVGQSEVAVRSMVDFFLLLMLPGAGDELQGIKRGVVELADALIVNKADGDNRTRAETARAEYEQALHFVLPATEGWITRVRTCSATTGEGVEEAWEMVEEFAGLTRESGAFEHRRQGQTMEWLRRMLRERIESRFYACESVNNSLPIIEEEVKEGRVGVTAAVEKLMRIYEGDTP